MNRKLLIFGFGLLTSGPSFAQTSADACLKSLIQDKMQFDSRETTSLALARLISNSTASNASTGVDAPIPGVGVVGFDQARSNASTYFSRSNLNWSQDRLLSVATQTLGKNAVQAYEICMNGNNPPAVQITASNATKRAVDITVKWNGGRYAPVRAQGAVSLTGGSPKILFPDQWENGREFSTTVVRDGTSDIHVNANIGLDSADPKLIAYIPTLVFNEESRFIEFKRPNGKAFSLSNDNTGRERNWQQCFSVDEGYEFDTKSINMNIVTFAALSKKTSWAKIKTDTVTTRTFCAEARLYPPQRIGGTISFYPSARMVRTVLVSEE